jgi:ATP-dependent Clp protease adaptor protein ClpS
MPKHDPEHERDIATLERVKLERPSLFEVVLHNDDYTTQEFVVAILMRFFGHDEASAHAIMLSVHTKGVGVAGVYARDVAETKAVQVVSHARRQGMPLECSVRRQTC